MSIAVFAFFSIAFSFGDIENSKVLQIVSVILRVTVLLLMCVGTIYYLEVDGVNKAKTWNF